MTLVDVTPDELAALLRRARIVDVSITLNDGFISAIELQLHHDGEPLRHLELRANGSDLMSWIAAPTS